MTKKVSDEQQAKLLSAKAVVKHKEKQIEEAIALYLESIKIDENQPNWFYGNLIILLAQSGQLELGVSIGEKALAIYPESDEIYRAVGLILAKQGNTEISLTYYQKSIALNQNQPDWVYSYIVENLVAKSRFERAINLGEQGLVANPDSAWINYHLADAFAGSQQWSKASNSYKTARELQTDLPLIQSKIDFVNQQKSLHNRKNNILKYLATVEQNHKNIDIYYKLIYENYQNTLILLQLAFSLLERNNLNNAVQYFKKAIAYNAELVSAYLHCTRIFEDRFDVSSFLALLQQEVELPLVANYVIDRNHSNWLLVQFQKLIATYQQLLESYPHETELQLELANVYARQNRFNLAIALAKRALRTNPDRNDPAIVLKRIQNAQQKFYLHSQKISAVSLGYQTWLLQNSLTQEQIDWIPETIDTLGYKPLISVLLPVFNPSPNLTETIESLSLQIYPYWELCLVNCSTESEIVRAVAKYAAADSRIKLVDSQATINATEALNLALSEATGDFIALLRQGDLLTIDALYEVVELLNQSPETDMIYVDEDKVDREGQYLEPIFKPDWCPDSFLSRMYTGSLGIYRRSLVEKIGGFSPNHEAAWNYDFVLRFTEKTQNILHIAKILYHERIQPIESDRVKAEKAAIEAALKRRGEDAVVIEHQKIAGVYSIRYKITDYKPISIIIPAKNQSSILDRCLESIFTKTSYPNYEVIVVDNGSNEPEFARVIAKWQERVNKFSCYSLDIPFNYSKLNNFGVSKARGDYLLFLNNDTEVISKDWLEAMVEQAQRESIGAVGAMLLYPDRTVQHAGVILGIRGVAGHSHKHYSYGEPGYTNQLIATNNYSAITAACLMCRRAVYQEVKGFDEILSVAFNDVDFCLKIRQKGYQNVLLPYVVLYHYESQSRGDDNTLEKQRRLHQEVATMEARWKSQIDRDPCYNSNLTKNKEDYSFAGDRAVCSSIANNFSSYHSTP